MQARTELQAKEQELRRKSGELQALSSEKDQTIAILQAELDIGAVFFDYHLHPRILLAWCGGKTVNSPIAAERTLRSLLERDKEKAEEIAALAMNLCSGVTIPP